MVDTATGDNNPLAMSDEDILAMNAPPEATQVEVEEPVKAEEEAEPAQESEAEAVVEPVVDTNEDDDKDEAENKSEPSDDDFVAEGPAKTEETESKVDEPTEDKDKSVPKAEDKPADENKEKPATDEAKAEPTAEEYKGFYEQIMKPFKANGKTIELRTPEEAIQLMQMGANYTRKLQDIQPHRKTLLMLENNGLLGDEGKLSFLIDLDKKDPEAIKKLIKDSGIDPMDIDTSVEPAYLEGNNAVSDEEEVFQTTLKELTSEPTGQETVKIIDKQWDATSKDLLWQSPQIMTIIHQQRESGVYDLITSEMDRQITLGKIPAKTPFLEAYKIVGDELTASGAFGQVEATNTDTPPGNPAGKPEPVVVETRAAAPKSKVSNEDKANAASQTRSTPKTAKVLVNPLAMSDDEFLKSFSQRL